MKKNYENPIMLINTLSVEDVLTGSVLAEEEKLNQTVRASGAGNTSDFKLW